MDSPSSLRPRNYNHHVFVSFHGPDVRKTLLSHIREQFNRNGITMFDDQKIVRSATIAPSLTEAIKESRISIVILSKKYASSSWCLDELVEILECKKAMGQIVMTIFYGVDPSDVRKQIGEFGVAFDETCAHKTDEEIQKWSKALREVGNIAGEDFLRWDDEENCKRCLIKKIAKDVSDKLNATPSREFDGMVGLEAHLREMESLLDLDYDGVKMVGITGPAGIGKTTIARALQSRLSNRFQLTCFVDNLREMYPIGLDEFRLQEQFLSKVLNQDDIRICHSGVIEERLCKLRGLIILDDVNNIQQLMALANDTSWFGPGSRIVVTTENKELLQQHGIDNIYYVGFPSREEAVKILCKYAFEQTSPHHGFKLLAERITKLCGKLPLGLRVVGLSLHGKKAEEWVQVMRRLETIVDHRDIDQILRVVRKSKSRCFTVMAFLVVINLLSEIAAVVADQLYSIHKPYFARISLGMSSLSVVFSILDLSYKIRDHKARFRCKWPIPWFYYPSRGYNRIFGSFTDTVLLFCVVGGLIVSTINYIFIERRRDGPIKVSIWPLFFAIGMVGSKFMEKPTILKYNSLSQKLY